MQAMSEQEARVMVITGNAAAAYGAMLCRPDVVATYPITPQTEVIEKLFEFAASGELDAEMVPVEGENSAMNVVTASSVAGGRVFTATSSWGLAFMYDAMLAASGTRVPVVMVNVNRETPGIIAVSSGQQDMISTRDSGWIQLVAEDCQEILDQVIMAYRLAEDHAIQVPVMVNYDGFYLSYMAEKVEVPSKDQVTDFLAVLNEQPKRQALLPGKPLGCGTHGILQGFVELRYKHIQAMERAKAVFDGIDQEFASQFGRGYGGQVEEYRTEDAEILLVASGSMCGTVKTVIDKKREQGLRVGLVRLRMYRPFPSEKLIELLKGRKAAGVVDRSVGFGIQGGPIYSEVCSLSAKFGETRVLSFIDGLANTDVTSDHVEQMLEQLQAAARGESCPDVTWVCLEAS
jgi:pyruvate/2-oxoacid:ferredoxin oxidoreductase alpha subunit